MKPLDEMGKFKTVVVDPPWDIKFAPDLGSAARPKGGYKRDSLPYPPMSLDQIESLKVPSTLDSDAFLFCWATNKMLHNAFHIIESWGLRYAFTMVWHKAQGIQFHNSPSYRAEFILVAKKGQPAFSDVTGFATVIYGSRGAHSEKPEGFYDLLRRVTPGPRLDVFGRRRIAGFQSWGNEAPEGEALPDHFQQVLMG